MNNKLISQSLIELSDAIEQLALMIAEQNGISSEQSDKQFEIITKKFNKTARKINKKTDFYKPFHHKGFLQDWLFKKNIYIGKSINDLYVDEKLYAVSDFLADHYFQLKPFYEQLKRSQCVKRDFKLKSTNKNIKYIRKWCNMLHRNKIIDSFNVLNNGLVDIDIAEIHNATLFINGLWLEIFLRKEIGKLLRNNLQKIESYDILAQVEIVKPNKKNSEIDLLLMLNGEIFWFECKSGEITRTYYKRFAEHKKLFGLSNAYLVTPQMNFNQAEKVKEQSGLEMLYATSLDKQLEQIFRFKE